VTTGESLLGSSLNVDRNPMEVRDAPKGTLRTPAPDRLRPIPAQHRREARSTRPGFEPQGTKATNDGGIPIPARLTRRAGVASASTSTLSPEIEAETGRNGARIARAGDSPSIGWLRFFRKRPMRPGGLEGEPSPWKERIFRALATEPGRHQTHPRSNASKPTRRPEAANRCESGNGPQ